MHKYYRIGHYEYEQRKEQTMYIAENKYDWHQRAIDQYNLYDKHRLVDLIKFNINIMNKKLLALSIVVMALTIAVFVYPFMPSPMASNWDSSGNVNSYMSSFWGVFLMPIISIGILFLFIFIPKIDPLKKNVKKFQKHYDNFIVVFMIFLF
jgi:uncharacterized membrane protein